MQPTGLLWQDGPLLWIYPKISPVKSIGHYPTAVAVLALSGIQHFGVSPTILVIPYLSYQVQICATVDDWANLKCSFPGKLDNHLPKHPLLGFYKNHPVVFPKVTSFKHIQGAPIIFTNGSKIGCGVYMVGSQ